MNSPYNFHNLPQTKGIKTQLQKNIRAVKLLQQLQRENRKPTEDERHQLATFVGWGTVASAINRDTLELLPDNDLNTDNAFQTPQNIIEAIWSVLENLGFKSGRILEPASNIGSFPGLQPSDYRHQSEWVLIEIDPIASAIARHLHPDAIVYGSSTSTKIGFQHVELPANSFDLIISNFPFGTTAPFDPKYNPVVSNLHNYFWAKSWDALRNGGIIAAITSTGTLDSTPEFCHYLASLGAKLIGAVRLPNNAFKSANTSVTADLIILQKSDPPQESTQWGETVDSPLTNSTGKPIPINRYFQDHPERVLGTLTHCKLYGSDRVAVAPDSRPLKSAIIDAFRSCPSTYQPAPASTQTLQSLLPPLECIGEDPYRYLFVEGNVHQYIPNQGLVRVTQHEHHIADALRLKHTLDRLIQAEINNSPDMETLRQQLNLHHDEFIIKYGRLLNRKDHPNTLEVIADDSELVAMCYALEAEIPVTVNSNTGKIEAVRYKNADIFHERVSGCLRKQQRQLSSPLDAVWECLERKGYLDIQYISILVNQTPAETITALKNVSTPQGKQSLIFYNPSTNQWVLRDAYLSGNTRTKLQTLRTLKHTDPDTYQQFQLHDNEAELTRQDANGQYLHLSPYLLPPASTEIRAEIAHRLKVQSDIDSHLDANVSIDTGLGASWIEPQAIQEFIAHLLNIHPTEIQCHHIPPLALWSLRGSSTCLEAATASEWASMGCHGEGRRSVLWLIEQSLNKRLINVQVKDSTKQIDPEKSRQATDAAIAAAQRLETYFTTWLWSDLERAYHLTVKYNQLYPLPKKRHWDGSYLSLPDSNSSITLKPHQNAAIARAIQSKRLFCLHECGTGKTFTMCAAAYEAQRLGLASKPILVVQNSTLSQVVSAFKTLYPNAKLLIADEFNWQEKNKLIAKIQTGRYHAIILTHSQFFAIPISATTKINYIREQLDILQRYIADVKNEDPSLYLELQRQTDSLTEQLEELELFDQLRSQESNVLAWQQRVKSLMEKGILSISQNGTLNYIKKRQSSTQKTLDKKRDSLERSVEKATHYYSRNIININWEDLGCDWIWLDEIHCAKNIQFASKAARSIAGITNTDTQRSLNTLLKYNTLFEQGGFIGGGTGSWPSNSISEMYNLMRLFAPDSLHDTDCSHFDAWISQYGLVTTALEFTSTGGIKPKTRITGFKNLWEMMSDISRFTSFATAETAGIIRPELRRYTITIPMNSTQVALTERIKHWFQLWLNKTPVSYIRDGKVIEHNPLTLTSLGSLGSIDLRLVEPDAPAATDTKLNRLIHNVWWIWRTTTSVKGTQIIFCDAGVPKGKGIFDCFNLIRDHLVALGIPQREVAIIHKYKSASQRFDLFQQVNTGAVRVVMVTTEMGGTGADMPVRCIAMHHADTPWTPASLIQRRSRGHRQGNLWPICYEFFYGTSGTGNSPGFDAFKLNRVRIKAEMAYQFLSGEMLTRHCEDIGDDAAHYLLASALLSGNGKALEHAKVCDRIRHLEADLSSLHTKLANDLLTLKSLPDEVERLNALIQAATVDQNIAQNSLQTTYTIKNQKYSAQEAGAVLMQAIYDIIYTQPYQPQDIGTIGSFSLCAHAKGNEVIVQLGGSTDQGYRAYYDLVEKWNTGKGLLTATQKTLKAIAQGDYLQQIVAQFKKLQNGQQELPQRVRNLTELVEDIQHQLAPLKTQQATLKTELLSHQHDGTQAQLPTTRTINPPTRAPYHGANSKVVEYIRTLEEPSTTDTNSQEVTWIDAISEAVPIVQLKLQQLQPKLNSTPSPNPINFQALIPLQPLQPTECNQLPLF
ncbi:helicase-related protein [Coleofasciculus sp. E2-BRE-01]|uniref:helicase-related protein n=1 Tax=Coleofasciculus sp. E2-BRE-01 TaxID=3069524 RepID=UPI0032FE017A